jgi:sulfur carrier protein ThiS adenylyltransferase
MIRSLTPYFDTPERCPYCGDPDIHGDSVDIQCGAAEQRVACAKCDRTWHDRYRLEAVIDDHGHEHRHPVASASGRVPPPETSPPPQALEDRDLRQRDILPPEALARTRCTVIGVGAIGRQVALQLAAIGVPSLQLIDFDTVEPVNLACQGYLRDDVGRTKVHATADLCHQINPMLEVIDNVERFRRRTAVGNCVFCCVDSIDTRRLIYRSVRDDAEFFSDGRMSAEVIRVLTATPAHPASQDHYPTTLFPQSETFRGSCTAKSTIFTANIAAGLMLEQFSRHLRQMPIDCDLRLNLLASEMSVPIHL